MLRMDKTKRVVTGRHFNGNDIGHKLENERKEWRERERERESKRENKKERE